MLTVIFAVIGFSVGLALVLNLWAKPNTKKSEMLGNVDESQFCRIHIWDKARFISHDKYEDCQLYPEKYPEHLVCTGCGWVPSLTSMVTTDYLDAIKEQIAKVTKAQQQMVDVEEMKAKWLQLHLQSRPLLTAGEIVLLKEGYDLYDRFVDLLPELLAAKEEKRARESGNSL